MLSFRRSAGAFRDLALPHEVARLHFREKYGRGVNDRSSGITVDRYEVPGCVIRTVGC